MKYNIKNTLRRGDTGEEVVLLQKMLIELNYDVGLDGDFGRETESAVKIFQKANGLKDDGVVGYNTISKLNLILIKETGQLQDIMFKSYDVELAQAIVDSAYKYIGQEEISGNAGFKTPWFHKLMVGIGFKRTHPWCAYFTELVWKTGYQSYIKNHSTMDDEREKLEVIDKVLSELFSGSVMATWNNFRNNSAYGFETTNIPKPGSLMIFQSRSNKSFGHIAVVVAVNEKKGTVTTVEGNTNDKGGREGYISAEKQRSMYTSPTSSLQLLGFITPSNKLIK